MPHHGPILRPRQLFPEVAAVAIQSRRGMLRARRRIRREIERIPAWTVGATAGIVGTMLAILLFFLPEPIVVAAPSPDVISTPEIEPTLAPEPTPVHEALPDEEVLPVFPAPVSSHSGNADGRPELNARLTRTRLPAFWDQREQLTLRSRPPVPAWNRLPEDDWRMAVAHLRNDPPFSPYSPPYTVSAPSRGLVSSSIVNPLQSPGDGHSLGLSVEKRVPASAIPGQTVTYQILVRNAGIDAVENVVVRERLPELRRVSNVDPPAAIVEEELIWDLGTVSGMSHRELTVTVTPDQPGDLFTETRVEIASQLAAMAHVTRPPVTPRFPIETQPEPTISNAPRPFPELKLAVSPVGIMRQGDTLSLTFTVTNVGTATAEDVDLYVKLSTEFQHRYGEHVKHHIDRLEPGQTRRALLQAIVRESGSARLGASLTHMGNEEESREMTIAIEPSQEGQVNRSPFFDEHPRTSPPPGNPASQIDLRWTAVTPRPTDGRYTAHGQE